MRDIEEREEIRDGKRVTVVVPKPTQEELERQDTLARLAALEALAAQLKPGWKPPEPPAGYQRRK